MTSEVYSKSLTAAAEMAMLLNCYADTISPVERRHLPASLAAALARAKAYSREVDEMNKVDTTRYMRPRKG